MIKNFVFWISIMLSTTHLLANGGPIEWSTVMKTGKVQLLSNDYVDLIKEDLSIVIDGDYSSVRANYVLLNRNSDLDTITYGFPVDVMQDAWEDGFIFNNQDLPEISFMLDGKPLSIKKHIDLAINFFELNNGSSHRIRRHWFLVDLILPVKANYNLDVSYKVKNHFIDDAFSKFFFRIYDKRQFFYDFSPAASWGRGQVNELNITADLSKVYCPENSIKISGINLTRNANGIYTSSIQNLNLKNINLFSIQYENTFNRMAEVIKKYDLTKRDVKNIMASSTLKGNYNCSNLIDRDFHSAWSEGANNSGIGERIVIDLNDSYLGAICLVNGYTKSEETYYNNNRIKKAKIEFEVFSERNARKDGYKEYFSEFQEVDFPDLPYKTINENYFTELITIAADMGDSNLKFKKITITILDVYRGKKYNDTCISEIYLLGYDG